jgi:hypothetical protein
MYCELFLHWYFRNGSLSPTLIIRLNYLYDKASIVLKQHISALNHHHKYKPMNAHMVNAWLHLALLIELAG